MSETMNSVVSLRSSMHVSIVGWPGMSASLGISDIQYSTVTEVVLMRSKVDMRILVEEHLNFFQEMSIRIESFGEFYLAYWIYETSNHQLRDSCKHEIY